MTAIVDRLRKYYQQHPEATKALASPAPRSVIEAAEAEIGFALPALLGELYSTLGNGGSGPDVIGLEGGAADDSGRYLPDLYREFSRENPEDPAQKWPGYLIPFAESGCGSFSCLDCSKLEAPVVGFDPNAYNPDEGTSWSQAFIPEASSLEAWLEDWLEYPEEWLEVPS